MAEGSQSQTPGVDEPAACRGQPLAIALHPFDAATQVQPHDDVWRAWAPADYWAFVGPFGGITAATVSNALRSEPRVSGDLVVLTVQFCAPLRKGEFEIHPRLVRQNRSSQFWTAEVLQAALGTACTTSAVFAQRRPGWSAQTAEAPLSPPFDSLIPFRTEGSSAWLQRYGFRFARGAPRLGGVKAGPPDEATTDSVLWLHDVPERRVDVLSLVAMSDAFFGRVFHAVGAIVPFGSVSMTTYLHATAAEVERAGITRVIARASASRLHASYQDQVGQLWSESGELLATCHQLAWFGHP